MKNSLALIAVLALVVGVGCSGGDPAPSNQASTQPAPVTQAPPTGGATPTAAPNQAPGLDPAAQSQLDQANAAMTPPDGK